MALEKKKGFKSQSPLKPYTTWWVGRDWLRRNCVFELATNGLKELF
jgi:hypothetical protein